MRLNAKLTNLDRAIAFLYKRGWIIMLEIVKHKTELSIKYIKGMNLSSRPFPKINLLDIENAILFDRKIEAEELFNMFKEQDETEELFKRLLENEERSNV